MFDLYTPTLTWAFRPPSQVSREGGEGGGGGGEGGEGEGGEGGYEGGVQHH